MLAHLRKHTIVYYCFAGQLGPVGDITAVTNCTGTLIEWEPPPSKRLNITKYTCLLQWNGTSVVNYTTSEPQLFLNTTVLQPNVSDYVLFIWAWGPPGQGNEANSSVTSASGR